MTGPSPMIVDLCNDAEDSNHRHSSLNNLDDARTTTNTVKQKKTRYDTPTMVGSSDDPINIEDQNGYMDGPRVKMSNKMKSSILWKFFAPRTEDMIRSMIVDEETTMPSSHCEEHTTTTIGLSSMDLPPKEKLAPSMIRPSSVPSSSQHQDISTLMADTKMKESSILKLSTSEVVSSSATPPPVTPDVAVPFTSSESETPPSYLTQQRLSPSNNHCE